MVLARTGALISLESFLGLPWGILLLPVILVCMQEVLDPLHHSLISNFFEALMVDLLLHETAATLQFEGHPDSEGWSERC
jgi:hypothetical protein